MAQFVLNFEIRNPAQRARLVGARGWLTLALMTTLVFAGGCRISNINSARRLATVASFGSKPIVDVKKRDVIGAVGPVRRYLVGPTQPSDRTLLFLRKNNLLTAYENDRGAMVEQLHRDCRCEPNMESIHAIAELAKLEGDWSLQTGNQPDAAKYYATAVVHGYQFLFDPKLNLQRNAYDPQFRQICDVYNNSLENLLRLVCKTEAFQPGLVHRVGDENFGVEFEVVLDGRWKNEEFERFELVNDYEVEGLENNYHTFGLGVPLIAVRKQSDAGVSRLEKYYPPSLALPLTAFCEVLEFDSGGDQSNLRATLQLYDPLEKTVVKTETRNAPLESDLTVPLAYYLSDPLLKTDALSTVALLNANAAEQFFGFYMIEPFDPNKIPVVMVHGLWSNPATWMKMFNDLRANQWIRDNYQFWFYMYPTGQPFWISAQEMRADLAELRNDVDPTGESKTHQEMVLVGHSMGGLISRMQTIDSGDRFWNIVSDKPIREFSGDPGKIAEIRDLFYFESDPTVKRVVTIASPHLGSNYANVTTRWLSHQFLRLPQMLTKNFNTFVRDNRETLKNTRPLMTPTSVDSLAPNSPFIKTLAESDLNPQVKYHNIVGNVKSSSLFGSSEGDGVVGLDSSTLPGAKSEIEVPAEHMQVHQHAEAILEVKRILIENLALTQRLDVPERELVRQASFESEVEEK